MNIGVIDDDDGRRKQICRVVEEASAGKVKLHEARSLASARSLLLTERLDLLILDIALPEFDDGQPVSLAGITLIEEVARNNRYKMPDQVIGLTALAEVYETAAAKFGSELWSVIRFDRSSIEWANQLGAKIRQLLRIQQVEAGPLPEVDLAIVTALKTPELDAVLELPWSWKSIDKPGDATRYYRGHFTRLDGSLAQVVAARAPQMGMPAAAALTMKIGMHFRPRFISMVGICAGDKRETNIGDIVAGNPNWDYGSGKHSRIGDVDIFEPSPFPLTISSRVRRILEEIEGENQVLADIRRRFRGDLPAAATRLHLGPFASGAAVVARAAIMQEVRKQNRKLLAIDMEAYGCAAAATELPAPQPEFLVLKGVSDFADEDKGDSARRFAAYISAQVLAHLCEKLDLI